MTYLYEKPDPSIHGVLLPELEEDYEFDFGIFFMDDIKSPETLRHRPLMPNASDYGNGVEFLGKYNPARDERYDPPSLEQMRIDEAVFKVGSPHKAQRKPFTALYQEYWQDNMDNEEELEFSRNYLLSKAPGRQVHLTCHRRRWVIYKEGQYITANESIALHNAAKQGLPVPRIFCREKLYAGFKGDEDIYSIKMSYIAGQPLTKTWVTLTHEERVDVFTQVRNMLLRLTVPEEAPGFIGSCDGEDIRDSRVHNTYFGQICRNEREFNKYMISTLFSAPETVKKAYLRKLNARRHRVVFCHGDLSPDNIIVNEHMRVVGLLDWEDAGYYPECWENIKFYGRPEMVPHWHEYGKYLLPNVFEDEVNEYLEVRRYQLP
ncbi:hypothetical protein NLG97_g4988 [Lecanicillium saksenae]|uniref:Uncharacterized protein n=1 Tax=Lecanicillium saksenae TaxID=468837 RepID=A0ACC1QV13_9HYPO|nr:hypothetical protein NLG97_g4988 [Lecanicillium saksenae]